MSEDDGDGGSDQEPALAAAEKYILGAPPGQTGNLLFDVDADEELPALNSIWECPMINKFAGFDDNGKPFLGGLAAGAPLKTMAPKQNPFGR
jgi:hypothetical protein